MTASRCDAGSAAIGQYSLWIKAHPNDNRMAQALNGRCWVRALWNIEADKAMADCDGAVRRDRKIAAFYDSVIAPSDAITFEIEQSYLCGPEVADVGIIRTTLAGGTHQAIVHGVYTYRSNGAGKLAACATARTKSA